MRVFFEWELDNHIPEGKNVISKDMSLLFEPSIYISAFSIYPYHWSFELTTVMVSPTRFLIRFGMCNLRFVNYTSATLNIPCSSKGKVYAEFDAPPLGDGIYYNKHYHFLERAFFDESKGLLAIGAIYTAAQKCIEIAHNQFVSIGNNGVLLAMYIQLG